MKEFFFNLKLCISYDSLVCFHLTYLWTWPLHFPVESCAHPSEWGKSWRTFQTGPTLQRKRRNVSHTKTPECSASDSLSEQSQHTIVSDLDCVCCSRRVCLSPGLLLLLLSFDCKLLLYLFLLLLQHFLHSFPLSLFQEWPQLLQICLQLVDLCRGWRDQQEKKWKRRQWAAYNLTFISDL